MKVGIYPWLVFKSVYVFVGNRWAYERCTRWSTMFEDYVVLLNENTNELEDELELWREVLDMNGLKIYKAKTKFLELKFKNEIVENGSNYNVRLGDHLTIKVERFK